MDSRLGAVVKSGVEMMTPERVFAGIGFITIGAFLVDRCLSLSATARQAHMLDSSDFDLMKKRMEHVQELSSSVDELRKADSLGAALEEINNAIREFHQTTAKREAAELSTNKKKYAALLYQRAEIHYLQGNYKRAATDLSQALTNDITLIVARNLLLHLYADCDELRNLKVAQEMLALSLDANAEQTFTKYYQAVLKGESADMELVNRLAQQLITDLTSNDCDTRATIPAVAVPLLMSRCMQMNVERAENASVLKDEIEMMTALLQINGLVVNQQLRLMMTESILRARLRMSALMGSHDVHSEQDLAELQRNTFATNLSNERVGCLESVQIISNDVIEKLIQLNSCEQYLLKPDHREELCNVMMGFECIGKFNDPAQAELKQKCSMLQLLQQDEIAEVCAAFVRYIKKQGLDVWTLAVNDNDEGNIHSLFRIACAESKIDLQVFINEAQHLNCIREYRHQPDDVDRSNNGNNTFRVVMKPNQNRFHFVLALGTPALQQQYLVLKACERVLAQDPENKTFNMLLGQMGFTRMNRKAVTHPSTQSMFARYKYPLMILGALSAAAALGSAFLFKRQ